MGIARTEELLGFDRRLDIFKNRSVIDPAILTSGLYPPIPVTGNMIVWGFHIVGLAKKCGIETLCSIRVPEDEPSRILAYALMLEDRAGAYGWDELERIESFLCGIEGIDEGLSRLVFGPNPKHGMERLRLYSGLPHEAKALVKECAVDLKTVFRIRALSTEVFSFLLASESFKGLSASEKRIFADMAYEVIRRDCIPADKQHKLIGKILGSENPMKEMEKLRIPKLSAMRDKVSIFKSRYTDGSGVEIEPPGDFEGSAFSVSFSFSSTRNFHKKLATLSGIGESVDELFELL
jgi:hypothetical protein